MLRARSLSPVQTQATPSPRDAVGDQVAHQRGVALRLQPGQRAHDRIRWDVAAGAGAIGLDQADPFGQQHRLDPGGHAAQRVPDGQRHGGRAIAPEHLALMISGSAARGGRRGVVGKTGALSAKVRWVAGMVAISRAASASARCSAALSSAGEARPWAQVIGRERRQCAEGRGDEAHRLARPLRQAAFHQRLEHAYPEECD
ncbi:hypothetical protein [Dankookia sp. P2]|uniref:hypothetical protein n=1 Tax=Dankookia sp. P2 TaxID=3423955 RepID=UPI003D667217